MVSRVAPEGKSPVVQCESPEFIHPRLAASESSLTQRIDAAQSMSRPALADERDLGQGQDPQSSLPSAGALSDQRSQERLPDESREEKEAREEKRLTANLSASVGDATAFGVMVGVGETYIPAFSLAIGLGELFSGLIATLPLLIGSLLQLISPWAVQCLRSHRRWVVCCAAVQGCCFLPLIAAAVVGSISPWLAIAVSSIYWGASLATGPAWNTWQGTIIPRSIRANFLARRSRLQQMATLAGFLLGGFTLQSVGKGGNAVPMFSLLFSIAAISRLISTSCLWLQSEPVPIPVGHRRFSIRSAFRQATTGVTGAVLLLAVTMQAAVYISGPFFNPYILKVLNFSYAGYAMLLGASFVAKFAMLPLWGRYAQRHGTTRLMWIGVLGLIPLAGGWVVSSNYWYLLVLQLVAGTTWAAYELALMLLFFETIPERERTNVLTLYNVVNSVSLVLGSTLGALVLRWGHVTPQAYLWVFGLSTIVRFLPILCLLRMPRFAVAPGGATVRPLSVRPSAGSIDDPVLTSSAG